MAGFRFVTLSAPVGKGASNYPPDVLTVQEVLNAHLLSGQVLLVLDGQCGPKTEAAIEAMERFALHTSKPDGRLDPDGPTLKALNASRKVMSRSSPRPAAASPMPKAGPITPTARPAPSRPPASPQLHAPAHYCHGPRQPPLDVITAAQASERKWHVPAPVTLAQWILESTWGAAMPRGSNNPFGIKATKGHPFVMAWTHEEINGRLEPRLCPFRVFPSMTAAFDAHGEMLATHKRFKPAMVHANDPNAYAHALTHLYATDSGYGDSLVGAMRSQHLYQYGLGANALAPAFSQAGQAPIGAPR